VIQPTICSYRLSMALVFDLGESGDQTDVGGSSQFAGGEVNIKVVQVLWGYIIIIRLM